MAAPYDVHPTSTSLQCLYDLGSLKAATLNKQAAAGSVDAQIANMLNIQSTNPLGFRYNA